MQIKTTVRYHVTSDRMAVITKKQIPLRKGDSYILLLEIHIVIHKTVDKNLKS